MVKTKKQKPNTANNNTGMEFFLQMWDRQTMPVSVAKHILKLQLSESDKTRISDLLELNREGDIQNNELKELDQYLNASLVMSILQSRARQRLAQKKES